MMLALKSTWAYRLDSDVNSDVEFLKGRLGLHERDDERRMRPKQVLIKAQCLLRV